MDEQVRPVTICLEQSLTDDNDVGVHKVFDSSSAMITHVPDDKDFESVIRELGNLLWPLSHQMLEDGSDQHPVYIAKWRKGAYTRNGDEGSLEGNPIGIIR